MEDYLEALKTGEVTHIDRDVVDRLFAAKETENTEVELQARRGMLSGLAGFKLGQFNVGKPAAGLIVAAANDVLAGLIQGIIGEKSKVAGRFAGAIPGVVGLWLLNTRTAKDWLGDEAVEAGNIILIADLITDSGLDIRTEVRKRVKLGQTKQDTDATGGNGHREINSLEEYNKVYGLA